ncbi:MAG: septum site-determining protein MinC [Ardenticatenaceae bacterium]|nr:septum site-determining protein MinC [Ardenticatenaceae bacterium]
MMAQTDQFIRIRGTRDGLLIALHPGPFTDLHAQLAAELDQKEDFFQGSQVTLDVGSLPLRREQLADLQDLFTAHKLELWTVLAESELTKEAAQALNLATRVAGSQTDLQGRPLTTSAAAADHHDKSTPPSSNGLILKETLRSGRSIYHEGHVVVIGDVNPGAEIIAAGDVVVWGRVRGLIHAGALGDDTAVICALALTPTQLRIADQIAIPPAAGPDKLLPEKASIRNGQIIAEPWQMR